MAKFNNSNNNPFQNKRLKTPNEKNLEMYGKVIQLMGVNNIKIMCSDGVERNCRIPGKMFKHIWIKPNDIVIIKLWDFQPSKADVIWRFLGFQKGQLERRGELNKLYEYTHDDIAPNNYHNQNNNFSNHSNNNYNNNNSTSNNNSSETTVDKDTVTKTTSDNKESASEEKTQDSK